MIAVPKMTITVPTIHLLNKGFVRIYHSFMINTTQIQAINTVNQILN